MTQTKTTKTASVTPEVYASQDVPGNFGFVGCDSDQYETREAAEQAAKTASGAPEAPTPEAIAADKASLMLYKATHAAALPEEGTDEQPQSGPKPEPMSNEQVALMEERGKAYRLYRVAQEIANCGCDLGDSERRIRLYYALEQINPNWDKDKGGTFAFNIGESSEVQS